MIKKQAEMDNSIEKRSKNSVSQQQFDEYNKKMCEYLSTVSHNANLSNKNTRLEVQVLRSMLQSMETRQKRAANEQIQAEL